MQHDITVTMKIFSFLLRSSLEGYASVLKLRPEKWLKNQSHPPPLAILQNPLNSGASLQTNLALDTTFYNLKSQN